MRIRLLILCMALTPTAVLAQLRRADSTGLALAIAKAIQTPIRANGTPRSVIVTTSTPVSVAFNRRVGDALKTLDSTLITRKPTKETMRINVSRLEIYGLDSAAANVALSRCNGERFVGSSVDYIFKYKADVWVVVLEQKGFAARGTCPKAYGQH